MIRKMFAGIFAFSSLFLLITPIAYAQQQDVITSESGNLYVMQNNYTLTSNVNGDAVIAAGDVSVNANVASSLIIAGGNVVVNGQVGGDVLVVAGGLILNGPVSGDVRIIGGTVYINSQIIGGDLLAITGSTSVSSTTQITGEVITNSASFNNSATNNPTTLDQLRDITKLNYGARGQSLNDILQLGATLSVISVILTILYFLGGFVAQYFVLRVFPVISFNSIELMKTHWIRSLVLGILILFASPFIALILLVSGIGNPLLMVLIALFFVVYLFAMAYPSFILGNFFLKTAGQVNAANWIKLLVGYIALYLLFVILNAIPSVGGLIASVVSLGITAWAIGGMLLNKWEKMQPMMPTKLRLVDSQDSSEFNETENQIRKTRMNENSNQNRDVNANRRQRR